MQRGDSRGRGRGGRGDRGGHSGGRGAPHGGGGGFRGGPDRGGGRGGPDRGGGRGGPDRGGGRGGPDRGGGRGGPDRGGGRGGGGFGGGHGRGGGGEPSGPVIFTPPPSANSQVDPQLVAAGDKLIDKFKSVKVDSGVEPPLRPNYGKAGTPITIRANHFAIKVPEGPFYEYKIYFQPEVKIKRVRKRLLEIVENTPELSQFKNFVAHDGSEKLVASKKLPAPNNGPLDVSVKLFDEDEKGPDNKAKTYVISFSYVSEINSSNMNEYLNGSLRSSNIGPLLSALNIILAKFAFTRGVKVGRDRFFFKGAGGSMDLSGGLEAWKGFYSSVRPTVNNLMVNVNVCYTAFYKEQNLALALEEFAHASFRAYPGKFVEGIRVQPTHLSYRPKKTVRRIAPHADTIKFQCAELGGQVTVQQYFEKKYKKKLQKPDLVVDIGTKERPNYVPAELCEILPNQVFKGKLADYNTAKMINYACRAPGDNGRSIVNQGLSLMGFNNPNNEALTNFGISISGDMAVIPARVLDPPRLVYAQDQSAALDKEKASWNLIKRKFFKGMRLANWGVFVVAAGGRDDFGPRDPALDYMIEQFRNSCNDTGMSVEPHSAVNGANIHGKRGGEVYQALVAGLNVDKMKKLSFILVVLSNTDKHVYATIRRICDTELGIPATCALCSKIKPGKQQYMANVALKINAKLGGVNHALDRTSSAWLSKEITMLVGMDVTHPGPGSLKGTPSIAGVVASYDVDHTLYPASLRLQESKKEMIDDLSNMMLERLRHFSMKRKSLPSRIIVFRDGVSEGQFATVLREEYPKFLDAFKRVPLANYRPKLTIIICGKRHHTRFFPITPGSADQLGNPKPGTIVDRGVTAVYEFDFFLQAHAGLKGSARPTHYTVIHDENKFDADAAQCLINYSSYIFARATKAVSLVPPAYYADLVCERGRCYIHDLLTAVDGPGTTPKSGSAAEQEVYQRAQKIWGNGVHPNVSPSMFYI
ncbi:Piwi-domain-containing protein [Hysterangium stoloniferum]|nr:Piwi-domain-containing protein [Hysterangium stoloniferum]